MRSPWTWAALAVVTAVCGALPYAVAGGDTSRPLSAAEGRRLALTRLRTARDSPAAMTVRAPLPGGTAVIRAVVDEQRHRAVGWFDTGDAAERGLLAWDTGGLAVARPRTDGGAAPLTGPASLAQAVAEAGRLRRGVWIRRSYGPASLDTALRLTLSPLARPVRRHVGEDHIGGRDCDVFSAPPSLRYWIDRTGRLRRVREDLDDDRTIEVDMTGTRVRPGVPDGPWATGRPVNQPVPSAS
ncbi:hypothetical protein [Streptomyces arenae]|uniref:hypothetical protein n=1 Tax=Streptomyces arenae TaxID=29301 RepID=UPI00265B5CB0|nr:hypothetical protein [Streptomyces arenae]MCG7204853.1 hypothetical protein [Streptomyces arenae]